MINGTLRPWGSPQWLLKMPTLNGLKWSVVGALSTQDRCLSLIRLKADFHLESVFFLEIEDLSSSFTVLGKARLEANRRLWDAELQGIRHELTAIGLFDPLKKLKTIFENYLVSVGGNVILDVSAFPERFFFPILRWLTASKSITNLLVTYMLPERYTDAELAYDARDWAQLPTFVYEGEGAEPPIERVVVGAGFLPFGLPDWLKKTYAGRAVEVSVLLPFPSSPSNLKRAWEFLRQIEDTVTLSDERQIARIDANDLSACFDRLGQITHQGKIPTVFAPYGPKPHSVAMCLQAINMGAEVFYTQPSFYHPEYTTGIMMKAGSPAGFAYAIKLDGRNLY